MDEEFYMQVIVTIESCLYDCDEYTSYEVNDVENGETFVATIDGELRPPVSPVNKVLLIGGRRMTPEGYFWMDVEAHFNCAKPEVI